MEKYCTAKSHLNIHVRSHRRFHHFCLENIILITAKFVIKLSLLHYSMITENHSYRELGIVKK